MSISRAQSPLEESASLPDALASVLADDPDQTLVGDDTDCARGPLVVAGMLPGEIPGEDSSRSGLSAGPGSAGRADETPAATIPPVRRAPTLSEAPPKKKKDWQHQQAYARHALVVRYQNLLQDGFAKDDAVTQMQSEGMDASRSTLDRYLKAFTARGVTGLFSNYEKCGRGPDESNVATQKELAALSGAYLTRTNQTEYSGSVTEAVRYTARTGQIRPELAQRLLERERKGRMVPKSLAQKIAVAPALIKQHRNPTQAGLDYLSCPGSMMWLEDENADDEFVRVGDILEADDATINFPVCVPWSMGGDPCSERWGVKVARFQWLVAIDRASRYVPGWNYTMRAQSSYRAEDVSALFHAVFREHGIWKRLCLEQGVWKAKQVTAMMEGLGVERMTAIGPNQKRFVEGLFHLMWTKLAAMPGQVGRYQGEVEETNRLLTSCRSGATNPALYFPSLPDAMAALTRATQERNRQPVKSKQWGSWVPEERWLAQQEEARRTGRLRDLPVEASWLFAPCMREWTVKGNTVGGSVQIMEGTSIQFDFAGDFLIPLTGAKVRVHFDPSAPRPDATVVLMENVRDRRKGEVLGTAVQVNRTARYVRKVMGWGEDADIAQMMRKRGATAMRREVRTIRAGDKPSLSVSEVRDGEGNAATIERHSTPQENANAPVPSPKSARLARELTPPARGVNAFRRSTPEEFSAQGDRLAKLAAASRRQAEEALP